VSLAAASIEPSAYSTSRPDDRAFCTAPREMPECAAYSRSLMPTRVLLIHLCPNAFIGDDLFAKSKYVQHPVLAFSLE
jgi:hypothetical protein